MFTLEPRGGLGNRLRVIASACDVAKRLGQPLKILWYVNDDLYCGADRLFSLPEGVKIVSRKRNAKLSRLMVGANMIKDKLFRNNAYYDRDIRALRKDENEMLGRMRKGKDVRVITGEALLHGGENAPSWDLFKADFSVIRPKEEIAMIADRLVPEKDGGRFVGLHIRRTDHWQAIQCSKTEGFVAAMEEELALDPSTMFYLATDSADEEEAIRGKFPGKVVTMQGKVQSRKCEQGIVDAYAEILCLSRTRRIYGSYYSSFGKVAAAIGRKEIVVVK